MRLRILVAVPALALAMASPALALYQSGEHAAALPALLTDRLRLAAEEIGLAKEVGQSLDGSALNLSAYVPIWTRERLDAADDQLRLALLDTVDPAEHERIEGFRSAASGLRALTSVHRSGMTVRLRRLEADIRAMAEEVEGRVLNAQTEAVPLQRPPLGN